MEQSDRENILNNIDDLIENTNYDKLMALCVDRELIYDEMKTAIEVSFRFDCGRKMFIVLWTLLIASSFHLTKGRGRSAKATSQFIP